MCSFCVVALSVASFDALVWGCNVKAVSTAFFAFSAMRLESVCLAGATGFSGCDEAMESESMLI